MKINEVEKKVGITKKSIRFYEQEGLLHPDRNKENGYRDYSNEDVQILLKIKFLRRLSLPIGEIKMIQNKRLTLEDALKRHVITLEREEKNLRQIGELCRLISKEDVSYDSLDVSVYLEKIEKMEQEGVRFMDVSEQDKKKKRYSIGAGLIFILLFVLVDIFFIWAYLSAPEAAPPLWLMIIFEIVPLLFIGGIVAVMRERLKEIEGGEENEAAKY